MGAGWVKNFNVGICDGAQSTAHSSYFYNVINAINLVKSFSKLFHSEVLTQSYQD